MSSESNLITFLDSLPWKSKLIYDLAGIAAGRGVISCGISMPKHGSELFAKQFQLKLLAELSCKNES